MTRQDVDLEALRILVLIADLGSISAAARAEQISQPAASKRIRVLEGRLRLELLDRRSHGAELTEHGRVVTEWARTVIDATATLVVGARALAAEAEHDVSIGASLTIAEYFVPTWLAAFRRHPDHVPVRLQVANSRHVIADLRAHHIDLGFIESPSVPDDIQSVTVAQDHLVLVVAPSHALADGDRTVSAAELSRLPLASREGGSGTRETLERAMGDALVDAALELQSNAAVKIAVESGEFAAVLSEIVVGQELRDGRLIEVSVPDVDFTRPLRAIWRSGIRPRGPAGSLLALASRADRSTREPFRRS